MPTSVVHETVATPNVAELARPEDELPPVLAALPQIPVETISAESVLDQIPPAETIIPEPVPDQIPRAETISLKPPSELALDLVLNEIVLQARLTTNATGGVLGLARSGELICRATTGATASDVAICLNTKSGIAATCFATGAVRRVDDLGPDTNADAVAYRRSGVRSILVVPVQGEKGTLLGILEIFSPRANAFCDRDVLTLEAMARRIAANIELIQKSWDQHSYSVPNARPVAFAASEQNHSKSHRPKKGTRAARKLQVPKFWSRILSQRSRLASVDWIAVMARTAITLVLIGGSMVARSYWQRSGSAKFVQIVREPMSATLNLSEPHVAKVVVPKPTPFSMKPAALDPSAWPAKVSSYPQVTSSITIQRQPVHKADSPQTSAEDAAKKTDPSDDVVLFEKHKTPLKPGTTQESKLVSKDPAAEVLPSKNDKAGNSDAEAEAVPTQAAMARLIHRVEPEYPNAARQQHVQGTVVLDVIVDASGAVDGLSLVSGESQLMAAAEEAVRQWRFQPLVKDGKPKRFESRIAIDFTLASDGSAPGH